ncbi:hypothetical protein [Flavobacterium mekongense]|uniref:hypothetical protein n=1 Tax=Flavobacterium mekongense TaxID=3379707 RepID=UPI00399B825E
MKTICLIIMSFFFLTQEKESYRNGIGEKTKLISFTAEKPKLKYRQLEKNLLNPIEVIYEKEVVCVSFYQEVNECGETKGEIIVNGNTIKLLVRETGKGCKGLDIKKLKYIIRNSENKKFKFVREKK